MIKTLIRHFLYLIGKDKQYIKIREISIDNVTEMSEQTAKKIVDTIEEKRFLEEKTIPQECDWGTYPAKCEGCEWLKYDNVLAYLCVDVSYHYVADHDKKLLKLKALCNCSKEKKAINNN